MSDDVRCKYAGSDQPRVLVGRHGDECQGETCAGCLPCTNAHCRVCGVTHSFGACAGCVNEVRENLTEIVELCAALPEEVEIKGADSDAMDLLGPTADPEAWGHVGASMRVGRLPGDWRLVPKDLKKGMTADDEHHPLWVLGTWEMLYRDVFDHPCVETVDVDTAAAYLSERLTMAALMFEVPFEDFAGELRGCLTHMKRVLHDEERGERANIDCFDCGRQLERRLGVGGFDDAWTCRGCHRRYTIAEYNFALRAKLEESALEESA